MLRQNFLEQLRNLEDRLYPGQVKKIVNWKRNHFGFISPLAPETSNTHQNSIAYLAKSSSPVTMTPKQSHPTLTLSNIEPQDDLDANPIMTFRGNNANNNITLGNEDPALELPNDPKHEDNLIRTRTVSFGKNNFKPSPSREDFVPDINRSGENIKSNSEPSNKSINNPFMMDNGMGVSSVSPRFNENNIFHQALKMNLQIKPNPYPGPRVLLGSPEEIKPMDDDIKIFKHTNRGQMFNEWYKTRDTFYSKKSNESSHSPPSRNEIDYFRATRANAFKDLEEQQNIKNKLKAMSHSPGDMDRSYMSKVSDAPSFTSVKTSVPYRNDRPLIEDESYNELIQAHLTQHEFKDRRQKGYNRVQHRKIVGRMMNERGYDTHQKRTIDYYGTPLRSNYIESAPAKPSSDNTLLDTPSNKKKVNFTLDSGNSKMQDSIFSVKSNPRTTLYDPKPPQYDMRNPYQANYPQNSRTLEPKEVNGYRSVSPPRNKAEKLPVISNSPNKQPVTQVRLRAMYQNPETLSHLKNSTYGKMAEEPKAPEKTAYGNIMSGTQIAKNNALKKKYEEMQYLETLFSKKEANEINLDTPRKEDFKNLIGTAYQKNFPGSNIS